MEQEVYVSYHENGLLASCEYSSKYEIQNNRTICWNCGKWFTKLQSIIDANYGYSCPYCCQSLRNHPLYGEHYNSEEI